MKYGLVKGSTSLKGCPSRYTGSLSPFSLYCFMATMVWFSSFLSFPVIHEVLNPTEALVSPPFKLWIPGILSQRQEQLFTHTHGRLRWGKSSPKVLRTAQRRPRILRAKFNEEWIMLGARKTKMQREIKTAPEISGRDETPGKQTGKVCITLWERICLHFCLCPRTKWG